MHKRRGGKKKKRKTYPDSKICPGTCSDSESGLDQIVIVKHRFPLMWSSDPLCHKHLIWHEI